MDIINFFFNLPLDLQCMFVAFGFAFLVFFIVARKKILHMVLSPFVVLEPYEEGEPLFRTKEIPEHDVSFMRQPVRRTSNTSTELCTKCGAPYFRTNSCTMCGHKH
jgi:hypothetical protein